MIAYSFANGVIEFGAKVPDGALPLGRARSAAKLKEIVEVNARHAYDGKTLLVPGVPEAKGQGDAYLNFTYFREIITWRLMGKQGWPVVTDSLRAARKRSLT